MKRFLPIVCIALLTLPCFAQKKAEPSGDAALYKGKTIMAVFAHSDDESSVSPVLAKYAKRGAKVLLVLATDGSKGVEPHVDIPAGEPLAKARAEEALCSTKAMGIAPPILLGYPDGELVSWDNIFSLDDRIEEVFTKYQPDVVVTWGPDGGYGHPDHRMVSDLVTEVFQRVASEKIRQLLYVGWLKEDLDSAPEMKTEKGNWFRDNLKTSQKRFLTYRISFSADELKMGREALGCCASQFTPDVMDDLFTLVGYKKMIYFRPWIGSNLVKHDIFE
jgi:LmbE family N-acetylglucosaminyl deacetylase